MPSYLYVKASGGTRTLQVSAELTRLHDPNARSLPYLQNSFEFTARFRLKLSAQNVGNV